jgi:heat shock protein HslJ
MRLPIYLMSRIVALGVFMTAFVPGVVSAQISGEPWQVTSVEGATVPEPGNTRFAVEADGTFTTSVGCNAMRGKAEIQGERLAIGPMASTRMACPEPLASLETSYVRALQQAVSFRRDGETLTLLDASGAEKVVFSKAK